MNVKKKGVTSGKTPPICFKFSHKKIYVVVEEAPWFCTHGTGLQRAIDSRLVVGLFEALTRSLTALR
jgi:hypothetical protein